MPQMFSENFSSLRASSDFMAIEHARDFRNTHVPDEFTLQKGSRAFGLLVRPTQSCSGEVGISDRRHLEPTSLGLIVKTREELGFPKIPGETVHKRAVQVGSFLSFMEIPLRDMPYIFGLNKGTYAFLDKMRGKLLKQIASGLDSGHIVSSTR
ncbi:MAG: hypothetical protein AAF413_01135 [Patescibacteria group bacterium]